MVICSYCLQLLYEQTICDAGGVSAAVRHHSAVVLLQARRRFHERREFLTYTVTVSTQRENDEHSSLRLRAPGTGDAAAIWRLVEQSGTLDVNSCYAYLLICRDFSRTSLVAEARDELVGFVAAYIPPTRHETLYVWQIGVAAPMRGRRIAYRLLDQLLEQDACSSVQYLEATVTPSNEPSRRLFATIARDRDVPCHIQPEFAASDFGLAHHEREDRMRIGPLRRRRRENL